MRIIARWGNNLNAPQNSRISMISAYTAGASALMLSLQFTKDNHAVLCSSNELYDSTGEEGKISEKSLNELYDLDFSEMFLPSKSENFSYYKKDVLGRRLLVETFSQILRFLPKDLVLLIHFTSNSFTDDTRKNHFIKDFLDTLHLYEMEKRVIICTNDSYFIDKIKESLLTLIISDEGIGVPEQLALLKEYEADGLIVGSEFIYNRNTGLTILGVELEQYISTNQLRIGAIATSIDPQDFPEEELVKFRQWKWLWGVCLDSIIPIENMVRKSIPFINESFNGDNLNTKMFALGYAKANNYARIFQENGIHLKIEPYGGDLSVPEDPSARRLFDIESKLTYVAKDWPYYSGGGIGVLEGLVGDFIAEVDYSATIISQATTLEMAVVNVDPGTHQKTAPKSFRDKDSFYDPHGAPPFVGVEHDENDGYRINWNLGSEYDNNQYGRPVGNGWDAHSGRLRLERRGAYFSAYYRNTTDARDWVCVGVTRNDSMNETVFLRVAGKRWRQEDEQNPDEYMPIVPNHFIFKNLKITFYA